MKAKPYDLPMIQDFLDHLKLQVRFSALELAKSPPDPELLDRLQKFVDRRGTTLFPVLDVQPGDLSAELADAAAQRLFDELRATRERQCEALESLDELFREALRGAAGGNAKILHVNLADYVAEQNEPAGDDS